MGLTEYDKRVLISLAHRAVKDFVKKGLKDELGIDPNSIPSSLTEKRGVFVAIYQGGKLRGCMGNVLAVMPIWLACMENARNAAYKDSRFKALHIKELDSISFEIVIVSPLGPLLDISELQAGVHCIILTKGFRKEVFLPGALVNLPGSTEELFARLRAKADMNDDDYDAPEMWEIFEAEEISDRSKSVETQGNESFSGPDMCEI